MKSTTFDGKLATRGSICDHLPHRELARKGCLESTFSKRVAIHRIGNPKNVQKWPKMDRKRSVWGLGTTIWVRIALRMQWNASRSPKRHKKFKKNQNHKDPENQGFPVFSYRSLLVPIEPGVGSAAWGTARQNPPRHPRACHHRRVRSL